MIKDTKSLILFLILSVSVFCWNAGKDVIKYDNSQEFDYSLYTDSSTGVSHIAYCDVKDRTVHYLQIGKDGEVKIRTQISTEQLCWNGADIQGAHDGETVYIAYYGLRSKKVQVFDTYFSESKDAGNSWSAPAAVSRKEMDDSNFRMWPKLAVSAESKRLFIFYDYQGSLGQHVVMMATKAIDWDKTAREQKVVAEGYMDVSRPLITVSPYSSRMITLHLYWRGALDEQAYLSESRTNGLTWEAPVKIPDDFCDVSKGQRLFKVIGSQIAFPSSLVALCGKRGENYVAKISNDQGRTWAMSGIEIPTNDINDFGYCKSADQAAGFVLIHYEDADGKHKLGTLSIAKGKFEKMVYPGMAEEKLIARSSISCSDASKGSVRLMLEELAAPQWAQRVYDNQFRS